MNSLSWGILGTGRIAGVFASQLPKSKTGKLVAIASRSQSSADKFAREYGAAQSYGSYEALLADPAVQAVYITTPHPMHAEWAIKAAEAGKHILCEKPLTLNHADAVKVVEAARRHNVFLMEGFMYRCHPQIAKLIELIRDKVIGDIRLIHASFGFHREFNPTSRLYSNALGGGAILDVGCYATSMSRLIAGVALGKSFIEPVEVSGFAHFVSTGVDSWAVASARFPNEILASLSTSCEVQQENAVQISGSLGRIIVPAPWSQIHDSPVTKLFVDRKGEPRQEITIELAQPVFAIEADHVAAHVEQRQAPAMSWDDTLGNMKMLDQWRKAIGLIYDSEKAGSKSS